VAAGLAAAAIALFPRSGGDAPPLAALALIGAIIAALITAALYLIVRRDLGLPVRVAASLAVAFAAIAIVKFVLAPRGLYEVNAVRALDDTLGTVAEPVGAAFTAAAVLALYGFGYWIAFRLGFRHGLPGRRRRRREPQQRRSALAIGGLIVFVIVGAVPGALVIGLVLLYAPRQYLEFVFSSWAGLGIAAALVLAAVLIGYAFRRTGREPAVVADVGAIVTLFWLGLGFLALYHVLWIVYVLVLGSIWPLRTVSPK
jgi:hypothetical protein